MARRGTRSVTALPTDDLPTDDLPTDDLLTDDQPTWSTTSIGRAEVQLSSPFEGKHM